MLTLAGTWRTRDGNVPSLPDGALADALAGLSGDGAILTQASALGLWDSGLIVFLWEVKRAARQAGYRLDEKGLPDAASRLLGLLPDEAPAPAAPARKRGLVVERVGASTMTLLGEVGTVAELGAETLRGGARVLTGRGRMRMTDLMRDLAEAGPGALLIVGVVNFLLGAILAFVGAVQLEKFAAGIYVASLVGIAMVREMAAVMTAIIMAGRTGGAYAARISTMQGNEEIDALTVFGIPVSSYIVLPAVLSLTMTMPFLYLYGCLIGMFGGFVVAISMLDVTGAGYVHYTVTAFGIGQFVFGLAKSIVFGAFIALTSCRIGLKAGRSAADVGTAATRAVVIGIVGVIALDAIFAVIADVVHL